MVTDLNCLLQEENRSQQKVRCKMMYIRVEREIKSVKKVYQHYLQLPKPIAISQEILRLNNKLYEKRKVERCALKLDCAP